MHSAENGEGEINAKVPIWRVTAIVFVVAAVCLEGFFLVTNRPITKIVCCRRGDRCLFCGTYYLDRGSWN